MNDKKTESYDIFKKDTIEKLERIEEKKIERQQEYLV